MNTIYCIVTIRHCNKLPHTIRNTLLTLHMIKNVQLNILSVNVLICTVHCHNCLLIVKKHKKYCIIIPQCMCHHLHFVVKILFTETSNTTVLTAPSYLVISEFSKCSLFLQVISCFDNGKYFVNEMLQSCSYFCEICF